MPAETASSSTASPDPLSDIAASDPARPVSAPPLASRPDTSGWTPSGLVGLKTWAPTDTHQQPHSSRPLGCHRARSGLPSLDSRGPCLPLDSSRGTPGPLPRPPPRESPCNQASTSGIPRADDQPASARTSTAKCNNDRPPVQTKGSSVETVPLREMSRDQPLPRLGIDIALKKKATSPSPSPSLSLSPLDDVASPLFFSHTGNPSGRPWRPPTCPTTDPTTALFATTFGEREAARTVTTVNLPGGNVNQAIAAVSSDMANSLRSSAASSSSAPSLGSDVRGVQQALRVMLDIGALEILENDRRPTFMVDLWNPQNASHPGLPIIYRNPSLWAAQDIQELLTLNRDDASTSRFHQFKSWVMHDADPTDNADPPPHSFEHGGIPWVSTTIRRRFRFISGFISGNAACRPRRSSSSLSPDDAKNVNVVAESPDEAGDFADFANMTAPTNYFGDAGLEFADAEAADPFEPVDGQVFRPPDKSSPQTCFDWTRIPLTDDLSEHVKCLKMVDWANTPLGPIDEWDPCLRGAANLVVATPHPAILFWGPDLLCIYNEGYVDIAAIYHPQLLGMECEKGWNEIWHHVGPFFQHVSRTGQATMHHEVRLFVQRSGFLEEAFFSWSVIPILGPEGKIAGLYVPCFERTRRSISERRMLTLRELGERVVTANSVSKFWPQVLRGLEYNPYDVPFSIVYSVKDETDNDTSSLHSASRVHSSIFTLEGSPGVPCGHAVAPAILDLHTSNEGFAPYMRQSLSNNGLPVVLSQDDGTLPAHLLDGFSWRGFGDPCTKVVVFSVIPTTTVEAVAGFVVLGINPRRPYDDDYKLFIQLLSRQLATSMASVVLFEDEIRRGQHAARLAAMDRQELSEQLLQRTQEASELAIKFTRMATYAPVGIFITDGQGRINYCNEKWWQISQHSRTDPMGDGWMDSVRAEDKPRLEAVWNRLLVGEGTISVEFRFNCSQQCGNSTIDTWVLMSAFPERNEDGTLASIFGCFTDISSQKWAERVQFERREEAVELKRQQENFIDMTSHEMRNPLSAVLQCVDQIVNGITSFAHHDNRMRLNMLLDDCLEAANTISLCASHQKRIVDDILTLSKLDAKLVAITPVDEQPIRVISRTLKMFESELIIHDIDLEFRADDSFETYGLQWARLDSSRMRQVLINLMTNAIKFTRGRDKRRIIVSTHVTRDISEVAGQGVHYLDRHEGQPWDGVVLDNEDEWGTGERLNLHCSVEDSGPGLDEQELKLLFQRFQQVKPRTHVKYGGSGLGLFISRILTEMHGGQIGVSSEEGTGSTFSFYIQCRKSLHPPTKHDNIAPFRVKHKLQHSSGGPASMTTTTTTKKKRTVETKALHLASIPSSRIPPASVVSDSGFDVLIVEDNIVNQQVLSKQLSSCGNNVSVANHGQEALQILKRSRFWRGQEARGIDISVILMDLEMPVMDGITCTKKIRELEKQGVITKHIPIIAATAYARPEQIHAAKAAGIDDVISKPFRISELLPKIEELVGTWRFYLKTTRKAGQSSSIPFSRSI